MSKQEKGRKPLLIGIIAAVVILAVLLAFLLMNCTGDQGDNGPSASATEATSDEVPEYQLYWNLDRAEYDGKSEAGMSSRMPESDGYFHVRFFCEGEEVILKVADRKLINAIDVQSLMGLEFDEDGIVVGVNNLDDMPLEKVGWQFYVQSAARTMIKLNSSESLNGMEVLLEKLDPNRIWDMSGKSGPVGVVSEAIEFDKIMAVQNLAGEVTHVFIFERPNYMLSHEAYCEHCKETVQWSEWVKTGAIPTISGHYQLQNDIQLKGQTSLPEDVKICLDLNGYRIDGNKSGGRAISMHNAGITLAIMDTSEDETGVIAAHGKVDQGGVVWVRYGAFYFYGGTLDASDAYSEIGGVAVNVPKERFFYMFGGTIIGGRATYKYNAEKNTYSSGLGGAVTVQGKFVMHDGEIRDGHAEGVAVYKNGKLDSYQRGYGGNLYLSSTAEFEMNGGTIKNGMACVAGGNIFADGTSELNLNSGNIVGGYIYGKGKNGGNVYLSSKTTTNLSGTAIYGGVSYNCGGAVYLNGTLNMTGGYIGGGACYNFDTRKLKPTESTSNLFIVNGKLNMWGGTIAGHVSAVDSKKDGKQQSQIVLGGVARITGSEVDRDLTISGSNDGVKVIVTNLYKGAKIGVNTTIGIFTEPTKAEYKQYFYSNIEGASILHYKDRLALGRLNCICGKSHDDVVSDAHINGCQGEVLLWAPWTSNNSIPTTTGIYFLTQDVTTTKQTVINAGNDIKLDLNGKNITLQVQPSAQDGFRLYRADNGAKLAITDTSANPGSLRTFMPGEDAVYPGKTVKTKAVTDDEGNVISEVVYYTEEEMRTAWKKGNFGMLLWARGGEISLHNGILDGAHLTGAQDGMLVTVFNNTVTDETTGVQTVHTGIFNMYGGTIIGGYTRANGNVNVGGSAVMNLYGGTITGGRANVGGNVAVLGTLNMYGGLITKGLVDRSEEEGIDGGLGGNVCITSNKGVLGTMNMYGGTISDGTVIAGPKGGGHGGNINVYGTLNATGGTIIGGYASSAGGNIGTISATSVITLDGVQVLDGNAYIGGNLAVHVRTNKGVYLLGDTLISGGYARGSKDVGGGNISIMASLNTVDQDQILVIDGATIVDGTTAGSGGNIFLRNATSDRFVTDEKTGEKKQDRYKVHFDVTMKSGTVSGGINGLNEDGTRGKFNGGNIYTTDKISFTIEGGTITGGDCSDGGGNIYTNGLLAVKGGAIEKGTRLGKEYQSGNLFVVNGTLDVSGGVIDGNTTVIATKTGAAKVLLSGTPVIKQGAAGGIKLSGYSGAKAPLIEIDGVLKEGAEVNVSGSGYISTETPVENLAFFNSTNDTVIHYNNCLFIGRNYCICGNSQGDVVSDTHINGCDGTIYAWERWTANNAIPTATGNFYLAEDVTTKVQTTVSEGKNIRLNLDGHNITLVAQTTSRDAWRLYRVDDGSKLAITDITANPGTLKTVMPGPDAEYTGGEFTVGDKTYLPGDEETQTYVKQLWANGNFGMLIWARGGEVTVHNAILDGSNLTGNKQGQAVTVWNNTVTNAETEEKTTYYGKFNLYGGEIYLGQTTSNGPMDCYASGTEMNLYGGTIYGGTGNYGGAIYVAGGANLLIDGATLIGGEKIKGTEIVGGSAVRGGLVAAVGNVTLKSGTITGGAANRYADIAGEAGYGGNIYVYGGTFTMTDGTISDGIGWITPGGGGGNGGNLYAGGKITITGGTITGGQANTGGNIGTNHGGTELLLDGVTISNGYSTGNGGNVGNNTRPIKSLTITENTVITGGEAVNNGGNIAVVVAGTGASHMDINIATDLAGGIAGGNGGNIYISNTTGTKATMAVTLTGDITGGTAGAYGGNLCVVGGKLSGEYTTTVTIDGINITDGVVDCVKASNATGGNLHLETVNAAITGATIANGVTHGTDLTTTNADSSIKKYHAHAGNFHVKDSELVVDSTSITGGIAESGNLTGAYSYGGNLYLERSNVTLQNGTTVADGCATTRYTSNTWHPAGNIFVYGSTLHTEDTVISGGIGRGSASNIYMNATAGAVVELGEGTQVINSVAGGGSNISVGAGTLRINGAEIINEEGIIARNIHCIAEGITEVYMSDGLISGGNYTSGGGNIYFEYATNNAKRQYPITFDMTGGVITGGNTTVEGGNIYLTRNTIVTLSGDAIIEDGIAKGAGGNIRIEGASGFTGGKLIVDGNAQIIGGINGQGNTEKKNGGSIFATDNTTIELKGNAKVTGGTATNAGGNIYTNNAIYIKDNAEVSGGSGTYPNIFVVNGQLYLQGGVIDGGIHVTESTRDTTELHISGKPVVNNANTGLTYLKDKVIVEIEGTLEEGSQVYTNNTGLFTTVANAANTTNYQYIHHIAEPVHATYCVDADMVTANGADFYGMTADHVNNVFIGQYRCVCGGEGEHLGTCGGTKLLWQPLESATKLPRATGNYYLTRDVKVADGSSNCYIRSDSTNEYRITIDLNGFDIEVAKTRLFDFLNSTKVYVTLANNGDDGKIYTSELTTDQGAVLWGAKEVKLYNVTIDGSKLTLNKEKDWLYGVVISTGGQLGLYGNTQILGGDSLRGKCAIEVSGSGRLTMDAGVVVDGEISLGNSAKVNMAGITDASMYTVNASGAFTSGNTITDEAKFFKSNTDAKIFLSGAEQFAGLKLCICGGADGKHVQYKNADGETVGCSGQTLIWRPWRERATFPTVGNYNWYLTRDVNIVDATLSNYFEADGMRYNLNLNGYAINFNAKNGNGPRVFRMYTGNDIKVGITDYDVLTGKAFEKDEDKGVIKATILSNKGEDGAIFWMTQPGHQVDLYGGIIDASDVTMAAGKGGTAIRINKGTFNQYGGTIIGGVSGTNSNGGTVIVGKGSTYNLFDGLVYGGTATPSGTSGGQGGNFNVQGTLNIYGGVIRDGVSRNNNNANNIMVTSPDKDTKANLNIYGGTIAGGICFNTYYTTSNLTLSGKVIIDKSLTSAGVAKPVASLNVNTTNDDFDASGLLDGSKIYIYGSGRFAINANETIKGYFISEAADKIVLHGGSELHFGKTYCLCGASRVDGAEHTFWCDGEHDWVEWDGTKDFALSGYYYLSKLTDSYQRIVGNGTDLDVTVDLNGFELKGSTRAVRLDSTGDKLSITDTSVFTKGGTGTGKVTGGFNKDTDHSGVLLLNSNTEVNLYAGTFEHRGDAKVKDGGIVAVPDNAVVNLYGATLTGGNAINGGNLYLRTGSTVNHYGGTITGGTATNGGNVYVESGANFNVYVSDQDTGNAAERLITGGEAKLGGNIYNNGNVTIEAGTVSGGKAIQGGNVYGKAGKFTLDGAKAKVESGMAHYTANGFEDSYGRGGNFYIAGGEVELKNGAQVLYGESVAKATSTWSPGGSIYAEAGTLNVENATISGGQNTTAGLKQTATDGNNLYINYNATVNLKSGAVVLNTANNSQENIIMQGGKLNLFDGSAITNAEGVLGRNIIMNTQALLHKSNGEYTFNYVTKHPVLTMTGGTISGGNTPNSSGANIYIDALGEVNITGGVISGGITGQQGGNIFVDQVDNIGDVLTKYKAHAKGDPDATYYDISGKVTIGGTAQIIGGQSTAPAADKKNGGSIFTSKYTTLTIGGDAVISGGQTNNGGGNIYTNGKMYIKENAVITGGKAVDMATTHNIFAVNADIEVSGGFIHGGFTVNGGTTKLSGAPVIDKDLATTNKPGCSLRLSTDNAIIDATGLTGGRVYVTATVGNKIATNAQLSAQDYILSEVKYGSVTIPTDWVEDEKALYLGIAEDKYCLCGANRNGNTYTCHCDGTSRIWVRWTEKNSLPTETGNYYLAYDVELTADTVKVPANGAKIALDLRGNNIILDVGERLYATKSGQTASIILTDSTMAPGSVTVNAGEGTYDGAIVDLSSGYTMELYRATLDASKFVGIKVGSDFTQGGAISLKGGSMIMHSGKIIGGEGLEAGSVFLYNRASFIMKDGIIEGGKANETHGGNVVVGSNCSFTMNGGEIKGGQTLVAGKVGGNVSIGGENALFTMNGGTISGGISGYGGNVCVKGKASFVMNGGTITGADVTASAGNVYVTDEGTTFTMNGGFITNGKANGAGNVRVEGKATFTMKGGEISGGISKDSNGGGNIRVTGGATFQLLGGTVKGGTVNGSAEKNDANIYVQNATLEISGGEVWGGVALHYYSGAAHIQDSVLKLSGAPVIDGSLNATPISGVSFITSGNQNRIEITEALSSGARVFINRTDAVFSSANAAVNQASLSALKADNADQGIIVITDALVAESGGKLTAGDIGKLYIGQVHCVCGGLDLGATDLCDHSLHIWYPVEKKIEFKDTGTNNASFYFYVKASYSQNSESGFDGDSAASKNGADSVTGRHLYVDLHGQTLTTTGSRAFVMRDGATESSITLVNTKNSGGVVLTGNRDQGAMVWIPGGNNNAFRMLNVDVQFDAVNALNNGAYKNHTGGVISADVLSCNLLIKNSTFRTTSTEASRYVCDYIYFGGTTAKIVNTTFTGARASDTNADKYGGAITVSRGQMILENCTIEKSVGTDKSGGVGLYGTGKLTLAGTTTITGNKDANGNAANVYVGASCTLELADSFTGTVSLGSVEDKIILAGRKTTDAIVDGHVLVDNADYKLVDMGADIVYTHKDNIIQCACGGKAAGMAGHTCQLRIFKPITDSVPVTSGNYYLTQDIELTKTIQPDNNSVICLDLAGFDIKQTGTDRVISTLNRSNVTLHITDTSAEMTGELVAANISTTNQGGVLWLSNANTQGGTSGSSKCYLYAGTFNASNYVTLADFTVEKTEGVYKVKSTSGKDGGALAVNNTNAFYMYGGKIIGGNTGKKSAEYTNDDSSTVTLTAGWSSHGGSVAITSGGTMYMYGGKISGGKSIGDGGNMAIVGRFFMYGGSIEGGKVDNQGGNIMIYSGGTVNLEGGTISGGKSPKDGGNIHIRSGGTLNMNGGTISGGQATSTGGNVSVPSGATFNMTNGLITGGFDVYNGANNTKPNTGRTNGNVNMSGTMTMTGGEIKGAIQVNGTATCTISGSAKIPNICNGLTTSIVVTIGELTADAKISFFLNGQQFNASKVIAQAADGVTLDINNFDISLWRNGATGTFGVAVVDNKVYFTRTEATP